MNDLKKLREILRSNYPNALFLPPDGDFPNPFTHLNRVEKEITELKQAVKEGARMCKTAKICHHNDDDRCNCCMDNFIKYLENPIVKRIVQEGK